MPLDLLLTGADEVDGLSDLRGNDRSAATTGSRVGNGIVPMKAERIHIGTYGSGSGLSMSKRLMRLSVRGPCSVRVGVLRLAMLREEFATKQNQNML